MGVGGSPRKQKLAMARLGPCLLLEIEGGNILLVSLTKEGMKMALEQKKEFLSDDILLAILVKAKERSGEKTA